MKKNKYHIIQTWMLLFCFIAGQYVVYAHQHKLVQGTKQGWQAGKRQAGQTVTEKCQLCDAMHHTNMVAGNHLDFNSISSTDCVYTSPVYNFTSLSLILAGGRAPPFVG